MTRATEQPQGQGRAAGRSAELSSVEIFRSVALARHFELQVARLYDEGKIKCPIYLSLGTEHIPAAVFAGIAAATTAGSGSSASGSPSSGALSARTGSSCGGPTSQHSSPDWPVFAQHRAHSWHLQFADPVLMLRELLGREDGLNGGRGGSASMAVPGRTYGHSGLIGEQAPLAVGYAQASGAPVICVLGDDACEEDYVLGALGHAASVKAPVLFIVEDNNLSILTEKKVRRKWSVLDAARGLGLAAWECHDDAVKTIAGNVSLALRKLPCLLNINVCRRRWHAGTGSDGPPAWNRYELERDALGAAGLDADKTAECEMRDAAEDAETN